MSDNGTFDPILLEEDEEVGTVPIFPGDEEVGTVPILPGDDLLEPDDVVVPGPTNDDEGDFPYDEDL